MAPIGHFYIGSTSEKGKGLNVIGMLYVAGGDTCQGGEIPSG